MWGYYYTTTDRFIHYVEFTDLISTGGCITYTVTYV